jgi:hypothetical protein
MGSLGLRIGFDIGKMELAKPRKIEKKASNKIEITTATGARIAIRPANLTHLDLNAILNDLLNPEYIAEVLTQWSLFQTIGDPITNRNFAV